MTTVSHGAHAGTAAVILASALSPSALNMTSAGGTWRARSGLEVVVVRQMERAKMAEEKVMGDQHGIVPTVSDSFGESGVSGVVVPVGAGTRD